MAKLMDAMSKRQQVSFCKLPVSNQYDNHVLMWKAWKRRNYKKNA